MRKNIFHVCGLFLFAGCFLELWRFPQNKWRISECVPVTSVSRFWEALKNRCILSPAVSPRVCYGTGGTSAVDHTLQNTFSPKLEVSCGRNTAKDTAKMWFSSLHFRLQEILSTFCVSKVLIRRHLTSSDLLSLFTSRQGGCDETVTRMIWSLQIHP